MKRTCYHDAYVCASIIGLDGERSVVRPGKGLSAVVEDPNNNPLHCNQLLRFWVSWQDGVRVGTGPYNDAHDGEFLFYSAFSPNIKYYKIATGPGSNGKWVLGKVTQSTLSRGNIWNGASGQLFRVFQIIIVCFVVDMCDLVPDVEAISLLPLLLTASEIFS